MTIDGARPWPRPRLGLASQRILRKIARSQRPPVVLRRPKRGFDGPPSRWLGEHLGRWRAEALHAVAFRQRSPFEPSAVLTMLWDRTTGRADHTLRRWSLAIAEKLVPPLAR